MKKTIFLTTDSSLCSKILSVFFCLAFIPALVLPAAGQSSVWELPEHKERINAFSVGLGNTWERETYISELSYSGLTGSLQWDSWKGAVPDGKSGFGRTHSSVLFGRPESMVGSRILYASVDYFYSREWNVVHTESSDLLLGPSAMFKLCGLYDMSNSNNTATGDGYLSLGLCVDYVGRFKIRNDPLAVQVNMFSPLIGIAPAPNYDQPYWFVYKYNQYTSLIHFAWFGNCFGLNGQVNVICPVRGGSIRVGYNLDYLGNKLGGHLTRLTDTCFTIGFVHRLAKKNLRQ